MKRIGSLTLVLMCSSAHATDRDTLLNATATSSHSDHDTLQAKAVGITVKSSYSPRDFIYLHVAANRTQMELNQEENTEKCATSSNNLAVAAVYRPLQFLSLRSGYSYSRSEWCILFDESNLKDMQSTHSGTVGGDILLNSFGISSEFSRSKNHQKGVEEQANTYATTGTASLSYFIKEDIQVAYGHGLYENQKLNRVSIAKSLTFSQGTAAMQAGYYWQENQAEHPTYDISFSIFPGKSTSLMALFNR